MSLKIRGELKIQQLLERGVNIPNPLTIDIGEEVLAENISSQDVTIYPGCRIYGSKTAISRGCRLGYEAPTTIDNCRLGERVELKGGFFANSVFLERANLGMGAHIREGCILEEEAGGAHAVGLKQTILFPFVTLGSLINFCDCLMAGGTSRQDHSEVGSSFIHFNFTPEGDKTTPSLIGDVPRGVMLDQPPIFLGGQGGIVGPARLGYGNVLAAGSILRADCPEDNRLIHAPVPSRGLREFKVGAYHGLRRVVENNLLYLANIKALEQWYLLIRQPFFERVEYGPLLCEGALSQLNLIRKERLRRLAIMADKAAQSPYAQAESRRIGQVLADNFGLVEEVFDRNYPTANAEKQRDAFLYEFAKAAGQGQSDYLQTIRSLPRETRNLGVKWLTAIVEDCRRKIAASMPLYEN